jgi:hypothetical protein
MRLRIDLARLLPIPAAMSDVDSMIHWVVLGCIGAVLLGVLVTGIAVFVSYKNSKRPKDESNFETKRGGKVGSRKYMPQH